MWFKKWFKKRPAYIPIERPRPFREVGWKPKVFVLNKDIPGVPLGTRFQQSHQSDNVYFHGFPISSERPEKDQVGIIEFEAKYVEKNPEWFCPVTDWFSTNKG